jgi:two-component system, OmpR family, phosphate regulon sensor histidine kinase PhoR
MNKKIPVLSKTLLVFYALVVYIFIQFSWWSYLLYDLNDQVIMLNGQLDSSNGYSINTTEMTQKLSQKRWMILGEGLVFLVLLALGVIQTRKSFRRESLLAMQQHNFLLSVTHELKTPVASLKLFLQTIHKRELPREKQVELAARALDESNRLNHLIENILLLNRMESPEFTLQLERINFSVLVKDVKEQFSAALHPNEIPLLLHAENDVFVFADQQALRSIIGNLLENAVKYAGMHGPIKIDVLVEKTEAVLRVTDQGPGIPDSEKSRVFNRFYRSGSEETRSAKGTGLGLFIVRNLVNAMAGKIFLKDHEPSGCIFEVRFKKN